MEEKGGLPVHAFKAHTDFVDWLEANPNADGLWVKFAKKANPTQSITYAEAVDVALCFGWIDGQKSGYDDGWYLLRFTPRRAKSRWSQINRDNVHRLTAAGLMRPAGLAAVQSAKADGRWDAAYAGQRTMQVPSDFSDALAEHPLAATAFDQLSSANRYAILYRITTVRRAETRERKIREFIAMLERGETIHPE